MKLTIVIFMLISSIGFVFGEKVAVLKEIKNPNPVYYPIIVDGNQVIITDGLNVLIYSLDDYKLKRKFGKSGEGPREFMGFDEGKSVATEVTSKFILVSSLNKLSFYSKSGEYVKEIKLATSGWGYKPIGTKLMGFGKVIEEKTAYDTINIYNRDFKIVKELFREKRYLQQNKRINLFAYKRALPLIRGNKIYINKKNGVFDVFNLMGDKIHEIKPKYQKAKILKNHKEATFQMLKTDPRTKEYYEIFKARLEFSNYFPVMRNYNIANGKIYILTYIKMKGKVN